MSRTSIPSSPSTKKISDLYGQIRREELVLQPEFQRKLVWTNKHKEAFLDTILQGYPFPEIYIAQSGVDLETLKTQQVVVDGQQRLSTIKNYIEGNLECKYIPTYAQLSDEEKRFFLNYDVVIRDLKDIDSETIREVFRRINQTKYNLNQIEIHNAVYDGEFISVGKDILCDFDNEILPVFNDVDTSRMGDLYFVLLIMATYEEHGYFAGNTLTDEYIVNYNDEYPNKVIIREKLASVFDLIKQWNLQPSSMWFRKSNFYTLCVELLFADNIPNNILDKITSFEQNVIGNKENIDSDFGKYYAAMYTGTNSRTHRIERGIIFEKYVLNNED